MFDSPHRRFNPLTGEWVLVSPQRAIRPWLGQVEKSTAEDPPQYDPSCYLCPGNERAGGIKNPKYKGTLVFDNDFSALLPVQVDEIPNATHPLLTSFSECGLCRVMCFSPRHDLFFPELEFSAIENVIETWTRESADLAKNSFIHSVQIFENKGAVMGCSNLHPHSQIWAQSSLPNELNKELNAQTAYFAQFNAPLLSSYLTEEYKRKERIIASNQHFTAVVPFWAIWPFEVLLVAHRP